MKQFIGRILGFLLVTAMSWATPVFAQELMDRNNYVVLKGGGWSLRETDIKDSNMGGYAEFAAGEKFNRFVGMEFGIGYMEAKGKYLLADAKANVVPVNLSLRFGVPIAVVEPYVIAGGGLYFTTVKIGPASTTTANGGYHGGLGLDLNLGAFLAGIEARYFVIKGEALGRTFDLDGSTVAVKAGIRF